MIIGGRSGRRGKRVPFLSERCQRKMLAKIGVVRGDLVTR